MSLMELAVMGWIMCFSGGCFIGLGVGFWLGLKQQQQFVRADMADKGE